MQPVLHTESIFGSAEKGQVKHSCIPWDVTRTCQRPDGNVPNCIPTSDNLAASGIHRVSSLRLSATMLGPDTHEGVPVFLAHFCSKQALRIPTFRRKGKKSILAMGTPRHIYCECRLKSLTLRRQEDTGSRERSCCGTV